MPSEREELIRQAKQAISTQARGRTSQTALQDKEGL